MLSYVMLYYVMLCYVMLCSVMFCSVLFCSVLFCSVLFCSVLFCSVLLCYVGMATTSKIAKIVCLEFHDHKRKKEIAKIWLMCCLKRSCTIYLVKN